MKLFGTLQLLLLALLPSVWASLTTKSVIEACLTRFYTTSKSPIPTTTTTYTVSAVATVTSVPRKTITPPASTVTVKSTKFVTSTKTLGPVSTFTSTSTIIATISTTSTAFVTVSSDAMTTTTVTPTETITTYDGFVYQSDSPYLKKRSLHHPHAPRDVLPTPSSPKHYPTAVTCGVLVDIYGTSTKTASSTLTVKTCAPTVKVTSTVTGTITSTQCHASVTQTITSTSTVTNTFTTTGTTNIGTTTTYTETAPTATFYQACATANLLTYDPVGKIYPNDITITTPFFYTQPTDNAYDCCVLLQQDWEASASAYAPATGICTIADPDGFIGMQCNSEQHEALQYGSTDDPTATNYTISAGLCGQAGYDGYTGS